MKILKKKYWLFCLILDIITLGLFTFYVARKMEIYDRNAWYSNGYYWMLGFLCGIIPGIVMFIVFYIEIGCKVCEGLLVPFENIYVYPYFWIVSLIIPIFGWTIFIIMVIYVHFWYIFYLKRGNGEVYL